MKRIISLIAFSLFLLSYHLSAQSVSEVMRDKKNYIYEIGYGETEAEADKNALAQLVSRSARIVHAVSSQQEEKLTEGGDHYTDHFTETSSIVNTVYLDNIGRHVLNDENGQKRVMRFVHLSDWEKRYDYCRSAIEQYILSGQDAKADFRPDDALKFFTWAYALLQIYPKDDIVMEGITSGLPQYCYAQVKQILSDLKVKVIAVRKKGLKGRVHYPYELMLDFTWKDVPVDYLTFSYFDGVMFVDGATAKDGRSAVEMTALPERFNLVYDFLYTDLARQLDPNVYAVLSNPQFSFTVEGTSVLVETVPPGTPKKKVIDTNKPYVESAVKEKLDDYASTAVPLEQPVENPARYKKTMDAVRKSLSNGRLETVKPFFTDAAWKDFSSIVVSGHPELIRTPDLKTLQLGNMVICRGFPVRLKFPGNKSFVEDVVFRLDAESGKIASVAYALSARTTDSIMAMQWEDAARIQLLNFLEDYRTAYCLKDINYIERVFADDAYIIVGKVLKKSDLKKGPSEVELQLGKDKVLYQTKSKRQYITDLRQSFRSKEFVNVRFEECEPAKGYGSKEGIYAVQVKQHYFSDNYADEGYLTLAIDMRGEAPLVKVRVWQEKKDTAYTAETMIERTVSTGTGIY